MRCSLIDIIQRTTHIWSHVKFHQPFLDRGILAIIFESNSSELTAQIIREQSRVRLGPVKKMAALGLCYYDDGKYPKQKKPSIAFFLCDETVQKVCERIFFVCRSLLCVS